VPEGSGQRFLGGSRAAAAVAAATTMQLPVQLLYPCCIIFCTTDFMYCTFLSQFVIELKSVVPE
jgi:hypothetical protein